MHEHTVFLTEKSVSPFSNFGHEKYVTLKGPKESAMSPLQADANPVGKWPGTWQACCTWRVVFLKDKLFMCSYVNAISLQQRHVDRATATSSLTERISYLQSRFILCHCYMQTKGSPSQDRSQRRVSKGKSHWCMRCLSRVDWKKLATLTWVHHDAKDTAHAANSFLALIPTGGQNTSNKLVAIKIFVNIYDLLTQLRVTLVRTSQHPS